MSTTSRHHHELTNGVGKCSVPMWMMGSPCGFCDDPAYGERPPSKTFYSHAQRRTVRLDGRYDGYVPGLACVGHGGPQPTHFGDPCVHCGIPHDQVAPGPCKGNAARRNEQGARSDRASSILLCLPGGRRGEGQRLEFNRRCRFQPEHSTTRFCNEQTKR